jgi:hypothetical protein
LENLYIYRPKYQKIERFLFRNFKIFLVLLFVPYFFIIVWEWIHHYNTVAGKYGQIEAGKTKDNVNTVFAASGTLSLQIISAGAWLTFQYTVAF